jgi:hypothetical protein
MAYTRSLFSSDLLEGLDPYLHAADTDRNAHPRGFCRIQVAQLPRLPNNRFARQAPKETRLEPLRRHFEFSIIVKSPFRIFLAGTTPRPAYRFS